MNMMVFLCNVPDNDRRIAKCVKDTFYYYRIRYQNEYGGQYTEQVLPRGVQWGYSTTTMTN